MTTLFTDHLRAQSTAFSDKVAYRIVDGCEMTFAQWEAESNRLARSLICMGVEKGDRVALYLRAEEALRFMVGYAAVHLAGAPRAHARGGRVEQLRDGRGRAGLLRHGEGGVARAHRFGG
ncbi:MAG: AMP-binding protein [Acidimicrobiales bacterium]